MDATTIRPGFQFSYSVPCDTRCRSVVEFLATAFGAEHTYRSPSGTHFEAKIGNSMLMIGMSARVHPSHVEATIAPITA